jgi:hypothetical protein
MISIRVGETNQYINFSTSIKYTSTEYFISSSIDDSNLLDLLGGSEALPVIPIRAEYDPTSEPEFSLRHRLYLRAMESFEEYSIPPPEPNTRYLPLSILQLDAVQRAIIFDQDADFWFSLIITEKVDTNDFISSGLLTVVRKEENLFGVVLVTLTLTNKATTRLGPLHLKSYVHIIGNLREEIIWEPYVDGIPDYLWHLEIGDLGICFNLQEYREHIEHALVRPKEIVLERIYEYLCEHFPLTDDLVLPLKVVIDEMPPDALISVRFKRRLPDRELFFPTGIEALNNLILRLHSELIRKGLPVGPTSPMYQKVLSLLLKYRSSILTVSNFANANVIRKNEKSFHNHLHAMLSINLEFGDPIYSEVGTGNSRIDLLIAGFPAELKLERRDNVTTEEIISAYKQQAADYVSRCESRLGFLVVLDAVAIRAAPTPPAEQDVLLVEVLTSSGGTVSVIGIVMRLPRSPSEFSE